MALSMSTYTFKKWTLKVIRVITENLMNGQLSAESSKKTVFSRFFTAAGFQSTIVFLSLGLAMEIDAHWEHCQYVRIWKKCTLQSLLKTWHVVSV